MNDKNFFLCSVGVLGSVSSTSGSPSNSNIREFAVPAEFLLLPASSLNLMDPLVGN